LPIPLKTLKEAGGKYLAGGYDKAVGLSGIPGTVWRRGMPFRTSSALAGRKRPKHEATARS
jgi:hypothetical protein